MIRIPEHPQKVVLQILMQPAVPLPLTARVGRTIVQAIGQSATIGHTDLRARAPEMFLELGIAASSLLGLRLRGSSFSTKRTRSCRGASILPRYYPNFRATIRVSTVGVANDMTATRKRSCGVQLVLDSTGWSFFYRIEFLDNVSRNRVTLNFLE